MFSLSSLVKIAKRYTLDSSISNEEFLNAMLEPYVFVGHVKGRGGTDFYLDASRASRLINQRADIPKALKKPLRRFGIEEDVARKAGIFLDNYIDCESMPRFESELLSNLESGNEIDLKLYEKLQVHKNDHDRFFAYALVAALKINNAKTSEKELWQNGTGIFAVEVGDLFAKGFGRKRNRKNVVVIPVDSKFDTTVSTGLGQLKYPHVSETSLHGMWLQRMYRCGETPKSLANQISQNLTLRQVTPIDGQGPQRYPIGTVAILENEKALFFLLATSDFDSRNIARSNAGLIKKALMALIDEYDAVGQGLDLYLPLMGTGLSRAGLSHQESYELVVGTFTGRKEDVHGRVTLVVCPDDAAQLGLLVD